MSPLEQAIARVRDGTSLLWAFHRPGPGASEALVEVRLDGSPEAVAAFAAPEGWTVDRVQWGSAIFLRRRQPLDHEAIEHMLVAMLELASANGMRLHSWLHGDDIG